MTLFEKGKILVYNYLQQQLFSCDLQALEILAGLDDWTDSKTLVKRLSEFSRESVSGSIRDLVELGAVVVESSQGGHLDLEFEKTWLWGPIAGFYHFGTRDGKFLSEEEGEKILRQRVKEEPSPSLYTNNEHYTPSIASPLRSGYSEPFLTLSKRRTNRGMLDKSISFRQLSDCLLFSIAITGILKNPDIVDLPLKMTPSGGARNPYEAYVCARNVQGLTPGTYHYSAIDRTFGTVWDTGPPPFPKMLADQLWTANGSAVIFLVANFDRPMWKYRDPGTYRITVIEAGHIGQNIMLVATKHGFVANPTCAINQEFVEGTLKLARLTESVMYALVLGYPGPEQEL